MNDEVWDCYANKISLKDKSIFIWRTEFWKHAFYMASTLALETKLDSIGVRVIDTGEKKMYILVATGIKSKRMLKYWYGNLKNGVYTFTDIEKLIVYNTRFKNQFSNIFINDQVKFFSKNCSNPDKTK